MPTPDTQATRAQAEVGGPGVGKGGHPMGLRPVPTFKAQACVGVNSTGLKDRQCGGAEQRGLGGAPR